MDKIISKRYYRIEFKLASALSVGNGKNDNSDKDILRGSDGRPYIPGTSLAGVYRSLIVDEVADKYFGYVVINSSEAKDSKIKVYDATMTSEKYRISKRDCVALDEWKTSVAGAKFDFEVLEPGVDFVTYIEQDKYEGDKYVADAIAKAWENKLVCFGSKVGRGLGQVCDVKVKVKDFAFDNEASVDAWLDFDMYDDKSWKEARDFNELKEACVLALRKPGVGIKLKLKQAGPISIRVYTTDVSEDETVPDFKHMTYLRKVGDKDVEIPVIPGTTWAGAFRHRVIDIGGDSLLPYFGVKGEQKGKDNDGHKSYIRFSESEIEGAKSKVVTRNSIDRFSGGSADIALFTECMYYGGTTTLDIVFEKREEALMKAFAVAITDLHMGFMSIGGETSIGHGLFEVVEAECNGTVIKTENGSKLYEALIGALAKAESEAV